MTHANHQANSQPSTSADQARTRIHNEIARSSGRMFFLSEFDITSEAFDAVAPELKALGWKAAFEDGRHDISHWVFSPIH